MNTVSSLHWISTILCGLMLSATGCMPAALSAQAGGTGTFGLSEANDQGGAGPCVGAMMQLGRDSGTAAGAELETSWMLGNDAPEPNPRWRGEVLVGHVWTPLPHRSAVGFEVWGHGGYGRFPVNDINTNAWVIGPRLGLPIRFESSAPIWDAERSIWATTMLVPSLGANFYVPSNPDVDSVPYTELTAHLALRFHFWSSLMP